MFSIGDNGRYWKAFGTDGGIPVDRWTQSELGQIGLALALDAIIKRKHAEFKKADEPPEIAPYLYRGSRYLVALIMNGLETKFGENPDWMSKLALDTKNFKTNYRQPLSIAMRLVNDEIRRRRDEKGEIRPEYNFLRDAKTWDRLKASMVEEIRVSALLDKED